MQTLLQDRLGFDIQKISIRKAESAVVVRLSAEPQPEVRKSTVRDFEKKTGYFLYLESPETDMTQKMASGATVGVCADTCSGQTKVSEKVSMPGGYFLPGNGAPEEPVEQNLAMSCIDSEFEGEPYRPYKKGILTDQYGKYIQLFFLSPALGDRQSETIQRIADQIGWRLRIAPAVNQNTVLSMVQQFCHSQGVELRKAPSYLPSTRSVQLKPAAEYAQIDAVCREAEEQTGLPCRAAR